MGRKKKRYTNEFRVESVRLTKESGQSLEQTAKDLGISASSLRRWSEQADVDEGKGPVGALTSSEREELIRLRHDLRKVTMERDFLKKAAAFFAREDS